MLPTFVKDNANSFLYFCLFGLLLTVGNLVVHFTTPYGYEFLVTTTTNKYRRVQTTCTITNHTSLKNCEQKIVLFWYVPFGDASMPLEYLFEKTEFSTNAYELKNNGFELDSSLCGNCKFTYDRNCVDKASAILFHEFDVTRNDLPSQKKRYKQKGIDLMEKIAKAKSAALTTKRELKHYLNNLPNSSLATKYESKPFTVSAEVWDLLQKKNRLGIWIVSNCGRLKGNSITRKSYMDMLSKAGLKVDVFGKCGSSFPVPSRWDPAFHAIVSRYKFYFAFENSFHCKGYISEKLWLNALYSGAVPVIFGPHRGDVEAVLPPQSYIFVEDFSDHRKLLGYLQYLDQNATAYAKYLEWRSWIRYLDKKGELDLDKPNLKNNLSEEKQLILNEYAAAKPAGYCALCHKLHEKTSSPKITNLNEWVQNERLECLNPVKAQDMFWSKQNKAPILAFEKKF